MPGHLLDHEVPRDTLVPSVSPWEGGGGQGRRGAGDGGGAREEAGGGWCLAPPRLWSPAGDGGVGGGRGEGQLVPLPPQLQVLLLPLVCRLLHHVLQQKY